MKISILALTVAGMLLLSALQAVAYDLDLRLGAANPTAPSLNVRVGTLPDRANTDVAVHVDRDLLRYRWREGRWWYRSPDKKWAYFDNDRGWISWDTGMPYQPVPHVRPLGVHVAVVPGKVDVKAGGVGVDVDPARVHLAFGRYGFDIPIGR